MDLLRAGKQKHNNYIAGRKFEGVHGGEVCFGSDMKPGCGHSPMGD
jgi:hypothetical protein